MRATNASIRCFVWVPLLAALLPTAVGASSDAGFQIEIGNFKLQVYYSVALDYDDEADRAIRDPRFALFTVASLLQANAETFSVIRHTVRVDIYTRERSPQTFIEVIEDPEIGRRTEILLDGPLVKDVAADTIKLLCGRYPAACRQPSRKILELFPCVERQISCAGRIRFGSFPSESTSRGFGLLRSGHGRVAPIRVSRNDMTKYFESLD